MIEKEYIEEIVKTKRKINELQSRYKELQVIFLSEVQDEPIEYEDAKISFTDAGDTQRLDKKILEAILTERHGELVAGQILEDSMVAGTRNPTVKITFKKPDKT